MLSFSNLTKTALDYSTNSPQRTNRIPCVFFKRIISLSGNYDTVVITTYSCEPSLKIPFKSTAFKKYRMSQKVLQFDKSSNNSLLFYCLNFKLQIFIQPLRFRSAPQLLKSNKNSWRYAKLKIKSRFHEKQNLEKIWVINFAKRQVVANRHL